MGGIINHHLELSAGLKELGHSVTTKLLVWRDQAPRGMAGGKGSHNDELEYDQRRGFTWRHNQIVPYKGLQNILRWQEFASKFDLIIWQVAVPTKRKENRGNTDWLHLYRVDVPQIAVIHDGNFLDSYPWLHLVSGRLTGLACVHDCAYNSARHISVPSAFIPNPFNIPDDLRPDTREQWNKRLKGFLSVQTWKAWKRVPELLRAIPHMAEDTHKFVAGKGIDYYYLTSKDKCKYPGVWDAAVDSGMEYLDVITNEYRDNLMRHVTLGVDASWSKKYAGIGAHFNRVQIETLLAGAVPVVRDIAVHDSVFVHKKNCLVIEYDASPKYFAHQIDHYARIPYEEHSRIVGHGQELARQYFARQKVADQFVQLATAGFKDCYIGVLDEKVKLNGYNAILEFFNAP